MQIRVNILRGAPMVALAMLAMLAACGGGGGYGGTTTGVETPPEVVSAATVHATPSIQFTPGTVNLTVGGTVSFEFGSLPHNLYFDGAPAGAPDNVTAATVNTTITRTFTTKGRFAYNCHLHPGMSGVINVQ